MKKNTDFEFNFYQYPTPLRAMEAEKICLQKKLELNSNKIDEFTIYISIPYCHSKCNSCPFFIGLIKDNREKEIILNSYIDMLIKQINDYSKTLRFKDSSCKAVYFGGGTASILSYSQLNKLMSSISSSFYLSDDVEITLEGNPIHLTEEYIKNAMKCGINRLSIGLQSFNDQILKMVLKSPHDSLQGINAVSSAKRIESLKVNIDLLYGFPSQRLEQWMDDIKRTLSYRPENIAINKYMILQGSRAEKLKAQGLLGIELTTNESYNLYVNAKKQIECAGYIEQRYGSFALPLTEQKYGKHTYCLCNDSIGLGAGAYSFINGYLFRCSKDIESFKKDIASGLFQIGDFISKKASENVVMKKYIMHNLYSLRLDRNEFTKLYGKEVLDVFHQLLHELEKECLIEMHSSAINVTDFGRRNIKNILVKFSDC